MESNLWDSRGMRSLAFPAHEDVHVSIFAYQNMIVETQKPKCLLTQTGEYVKADHFRIRHQREENYPSAYTRTKSIHPATLLHAQSHIYVLKCVHAVLCNHLRNDARAGASVVT